MSTLAIDINDAELVVADGTGVLAAEPGYAAVADGSIVTGTEAYAQVRLKPHQTSNTHWDTLSMEPGSAGVEGVGSLAELAFAQLSSLWERFAAPGADAVLAVPGHYDRAQLGLLLGLAQECGMPVRAMINAAAAASECPYPDHQLVYVDAGLHRVSVTPLEQGDGVAAEPQKILNGVGLASLLDLWARRVAEIFVLQTRFDPFHHAESEQRVYDRLPEWLAALRENTGAELVISHGGEEHRVEVERDQLLGVADGFYRALVQLIAQCRTESAGLVVQLSHRLLPLPGIVSGLRRLDDAHIVPMDAGAAAIGALRGLDGPAPSGGEVKLLKRLPWRGEPVRLASPASREAKYLPDRAGSAPRATHVVYRGVAYAAEDAPLYIGREAVNGNHTIVIDDGQSAVSRSHCELVRRDGELKLRDLSRFGTFVNEKRVSGEIALRPADVIRIGSPGEELHVIVLEERDGP